MHIEDYYGHCRRRNKFQFEETRQELTIFYSQYFRPTRNTDTGDYAQTLAQIQNLGVRTQAIGLGSIDNGYLSKFGYDSFDYATPYDPLFGIASPSSPLPHLLYTLTTIFRKHFVLGERMCWAVLYHASLSLSLSLPLSDLPQIRPTICGAVFERSEMSLSSLDAGS
jgi:hypothetical protein